MPAIPDFFGVSAKDAADRPSGTSRLVNVYREPSERGIICRPVPGLVPFTDLGGLLLRAMTRIDGELIVAQAGSLKRIDGEGVITTLRTIPDAADTQIAGLNGAIAVVADGAYRVYTADGESETPADGAFSRYGGLVVTAGRVLLTEKDGRRVQWSDVNKPGTLDGISFATAELRDDNIVRPMLIGPEVWIFKQTCCERWYATGLGFAVIPGGLMDVGLKGPRLIAAVPGGAFFVDDQNAVRMTLGGLPEVISTPEVNTHLAAYTPRDCFTAFWEGRPFLVVTFRERPAWVFDPRTREWFERAEDVDLGPWSAVASAEAFGRHLVGMQDGRILALSGGSDDDGTPLVKRMVSRTITNEGRPFKATRFEAMAEVGRTMVDTRSPSDATAVGAGLGALEVGTDTVLEAGPGITPRTAQVGLRFSIDHGRTWSAMQARSLGDAGAHERRLVWRNLSKPQMRAFTVEMTYGAAPDVAIDATATVDLA